MKREQLNLLFMNLVIKLLLQIAWAVCDKDEELGKTIEMCEDFVGTLAEALAEFEKKASRLN